MCYPKFSVYAEWLSEKEIEDIEEKLVVPRALTHFADGAVFGEFRVRLRLQLGGMAAGERSSVPSEHALAAKTRGRAGTRRRGVSQKDSSSASSREGVQGRRHILSFRETASLRSSSSRK